ncbi:glycosyltransferase family 2 protein [Chrysiogenes arsenatis]|uniref:glycosyltransferase family 2 protein n=1 Tax=Chrysiogenes arsenatis TaxID=309797 RepID=UPI0004249C7F|nr:glycosyltransferase [Chrysiogenes arsenatis]
MNASPFISVLINNYNYGRFIAQCVESVLKQTYTNYELIIVDDGSTDDSVNVLESFSDPRITKIYKKNGGQASAFNAGFEASKGRIIAFLDSDDWWLPHKLETIVKWDNFLGSSYGVLQHMTTVWDNGKTYPFHHAMYSGDCFRLSASQGILGIFVGTSGLCFRREVLEKVMPVPLQLRISADAYLTRTCWLFNGVISIPESLSYYRKHNNAVFGNSSYSHNKFHHNVLFPVLNQFYEKTGLDFRFSSQQPERKNHSQVLHRLMLENRLSEVTRAYPRIAFFGAGQYTEWLSDFMSDYKKEHITAILDDFPDKTKAFWGLTPQNPIDWDTSQADAIILSSDCKQEMMRKRCLDLFGEALPLIDLYEGLPEGPYPK